MDNRFVSLIPDWEEHGLDEKELMFVGEYISNKFQPGEAYRAAFGRTEKSANQVRGIAFDILQRKNVQSAIRAFFNKWLAEKKGKLEVQLIETMQRRAFYDPSTFYGTTGEPIFATWDAVPEEWRCVVDSIETKVYGKNADKEMIVMKLADRDKALDKLGKYMSLFKDLVDVSVKMSTETETKLSNIFNGAARSEAPIEKKEEAPIEKKEEESEK